MTKQQTILCILIVGTGILFLGCEAMATLFHGEKPEQPPVTYTVTFNANGASGTPPSTQTVNDGTVIGLPDKGSLGKGNDIFAGWNESADGGGTTYSVGASITVTKDMIFHAQWLDSSTPQYTVTFSANGATSGAVPAPQTVYSGIIITVPGQGTLAYNGKTFGGWNTQANGGGTNYGAGATFAVTENVTLYAKWQSTVQYTVIYNANGASGNEPDAQTVDSGTVITLPEEGNMIYSGKVFDGWNTQANGNGTDFAEGTSYTVNADITLYAKWGNIPIETPGSTLTDKLSWLESNAASYNTYIITMDYDEGFGGKSLSYSNRSNITLRIRNTDMRTISLSSNGALFTVGSGVTLILDSNITLQGRSNNVSLVRVSNGGTLIMNTGTRITGNTNVGAYTSVMGGGGVYVSGGIFIMNGGEISGNIESSSFSSYSYSKGGGVYVGSGTFTMNGGEISGNIVSNSYYGSDSIYYSYGGGVYVSQGTFTKNGGTIYGSNRNGKCNTVQNKSGTLLDNRGHAIYAGSNPAKKMENTVGPEVYLLFNYNKGSPVWSEGGSKVLKPSNK